MPLGTHLLRERKPGKRPPAGLLSSKNKPVQSCRRGIRRKGRPRGRPPKKIPTSTQQHLILRSLTLALT